MKKTMKTLLIAVLLAGIAMQARGTNPAKSAAGYFDIYLKNNCSKTVEVRVRADGSSSVSSYNTSEKHKVSVKEGYEVYVDGKLFLKLKESDSGKEINLCN
jgi:hypothetical protein